MLGCARYSHLLQVRGLRGRPPYFGNRHQNILFSRNIRPIRIIFGMENQGIVAFSVCASFLDPPLSNGLRGNGPQIRHFFKNLVKFYLSDCTEPKIRASGACPNVKLWSAMRLTPGKEAQAGAPHFGSNHKNIFSSQTTWRFERNLV